MKVYKYLLRVTDEQHLDLPDGAGIIAVQTQQDQVCLWALVDPACPPVRRRILMFGTGHTVPDAGPLKYLGTVQLHGGVLVFHVFEG